MPLQHEIADISTVCESIDFDKTLDLSGYPLTIPTSEYFFNVEGLNGAVFKRNPFKMFIETGRLIWKKIGANITYLPYTLKSNGRNYRNNTTNDMTAAVLRGKYESRAIHDYQRGFWKNEVILYRRAGLCFIAKKEKPVIFEYLIKEFPLKAFIIFVVLFTSVILFFGYLLKKNNADIALDVLRAAVGSSMIQQPDIFVGRFVFILMMFTFIILGNFFQSQLSAILVTITPRHREIRSAADAVEHYHKFYGNKYFSQYFYDTVLWDKIEEVSNLNNCLELLRLEKNAICITDCQWVNYVLQENQEFHISKNEEFIRYNVLLVRDESPLRLRMQKISLSLFESGLMQYLIDIEKLDYIVPKATEYQMITIEQLKQCSYILICLYAISLLVFVIEIVKKLLLPVNSCIFVRNNNILK